MTRAFHLTLVLALTCAVSGAGKIAHCFDHRGYESAAERSSEYVHGHDNQGPAWLSALCSHPEI